MVDAWHRAGIMIRRIFHLLVLFAVLRLILGVAIIVLFDREAVAWGHEATLVVTAACAVSVGVALWVSRWSPARGSGL